MRVLTDTIPVKGAAAERSNSSMRHGPVIFEDPANRKAYAVRAAWMETGGAPYLASLRMNQARTWEEFREARGYNRMPAENMVWADRTGTIGWQAAGIQPLRRNWSGLLPVPGDGRYEWDGYLPITALPHEVNPSRLRRDGEPLPLPQRLSLSRGGALHLGRPALRLAHQRDADSGRRFSVAEVARLQRRRPVDSGARPVRCCATCRSPRRRRPAPATRCWPGTSSWTRTRCRPASTP